MIRLPNPEAHRAAGWSNSTCGPVGEVDPDTWRYGEGLLLKNRYRHSARNSVRPEQYCTRPATDLKRVVVSSSGFVWPRFGPFFHLVQVDRLSYITAGRVGKAVQRIGRFTRLADEIENRLPVGENMLGGLGWVGLGDHVSDQSFLAGIVFSGKYRSIDNGTMVSQLGFNLAQFDAEAANLDLVINSSQKLELAIGQPAGLSPVLYSRAPGTRLNG